MIALRQEQGRFGDSQGTALSIEGGLHAERQCSLVRTMAKGELIDDRDTQRLEAILVIDSYGSPS